MNGVLMLLLLLLGIVCLQAAALGVVLPEWRRLKAENTKLRQEKEVIHG